MSRRIRVNLTRWVCRMIGHNWRDHDTSWAYYICDRCGRVW